MTTHRRSPGKDRPTGLRIRGSDSPISRELNIGPVSGRWLAYIGIRSISDVERVGPPEIYRLLKQQGLRVSLNLVYALKGALLGVHWTQLPAGKKTELRRRVGKVRSR